MGGFALTLGVAAAIWLLYSELRGGRRRGVLARAVVWLGLSATALYAKIWPLAGMLLVGAGAVVLIERLKEARFGETGADAAPPERGRRPMSADEARAILGVGADAASDDIRAAHRRLIAKVHPDAGGSNALAAQINAARALLLSEDGE